MKMSAKKGIEAKENIDRQSQNLAFVVGDFDKHCEFVCFLHSGE